MRRHPREAELIEPEERDGANGRVARRPWRHVGQPRFQTRQIPQGPEHQLPGERLLARIELRVEPRTPGRAERAAVAEHTREQRMGDTAG